MTTNHASASLPLTGLKVLSVEQYGAGPFATQYLASFGADVIKIENRAMGGDVARISGPNRLGPEDSLYFQAFNQGKRSLSLDLKHPQGQRVLHRMLTQVDVLANNLRGDQPEKLGLTYSALSAVNTRLVCVHLSAYGRDNERRSWGGYDYLMQAEAGFMALTGEPGGTPQRAGLSLVDYMTGMNQLFAVMAGVFQARERGTGADFDVSLFDTALYQLSYPALWYLNEGLEIERQPRSAHPDATPSQLVKTRDGWLFFMCQIEKFWQAFVAHRPTPGLTDHPDFATMALRRENRDRLTSALDALFSTRTCAEWLDELRGRVPVAPVLSLSDALHNPFVEQVEMIQSVDHPARPDMQVLANPIRVNGERVPARPGPHRIGEDSQAVLTEFGFSNEEWHELVEQGVVA